MAIKSRIRRFLERIVRKTNMSKTKKFGNKIPTAYIARNFKFTFMDPIKIYISQQVFEKFLLPYINSNLNKVSSIFKSTNEKIKSVLQNKFVEYLDRYLDKFEHIPTLVLRRDQIRLVDIYIPLTLTDITNFKNQFEINDYTSEVFAINQHILIIDTAGMGKSTLMKLLFMSIIKEGVGIPLFIELRRINEKNRLLDELVKNLNGIETTFNSESLIELLTSTKFIILLDGFDEIPFENKGFVINDINNFVERNKKSNIIMTSRDEASLNSFSRFKRYNINPLTEEQAFDLLRKYDTTTKKSELLIEKIQDAKNNSIKEFLSNPLLVTLLYSAFEYKATIPLKKHVFYRQVFDAFFESHDLTKGDSYIHPKKCKLDIDSFHKVLRFIGFETIRQGKVEYSRDELNLVVNKYIQSDRYNSLQVSDFIYDITHTVPLFTLDGIYYRWSHKSLQEYFAAQFIALDSNSHSDMILEQISNKASSLLRHYNLLDLLASIDPRLFNESVAKRYLIKYIEYYKNTKRQYPGLEDDFLKERASILYTNTFVIVKRDHNNNGENLFTSQVVSLLNSESLNTNQDSEIQSIMIHEFESYDYSYSIFSGGRIEYSALGLFYDHNIVVYDYIREGSHPAIGETLDRFNFPFDIPVKLDLYDIEFHPGELWASRELSRIFRYILANENHNERSIYYNLSKVIERLKEIEDNIENQQNMEFTFE